jgi:hypothetical protein
MRNKSFSALQGIAGDRNPKGAQRETKREAEQRPRRATDKSAAVPEREQRWVEQWREKILISMLFKGVNGAGIFLKGDSEVCF